MTAPNATFDSLLRPTKWDDYIGQEQIKESLLVHLRASKARGSSAEHILLYGPPGLGKTTLSHLIASEIGTQLKATSGPAIEKVGDLASILTNLQPYDVLFIDEIHRLNKMIEEVLYPAMERGVLDIVLGKGPSARTLQLDIPPFTLIAATTRIALVSAPLRSRFSGGVFRLDPYSHDQMHRIVSRSAELLDIDMSHEAIDAIVVRSRQTPRTANFITKRVMDFAQVHNLPYSDETVRSACELLGIDDLGLNPIDRSYLDVLVNKFGSGPVGIKTLAGSLDEDESTLEEVIEPYLLRLGLLDKSARGRIATEKAIEHIAQSLR
jgi:Holliday junction DNA helicase RuvB